MLEAGLSVFGAAGTAWLAGCRGVRARTPVTARGSDSELNLVQRLAEAFMERRPDVAVGVTGGGSGVGIAALLDGTTDIATSSRPLSPHERLLALRKGRSPRAIVFATDALAVIVHRSNRLVSATLDEVGALFRGERARWDDGAPLVAYGRQSSSGTYVFFKASVLRGDYASTVRELSGTAQIVEAVSHDPGGVGYVAAGYLRHGAEVRVVPIRSALSAEAVDPLDEAAVLEGRYAITRPLFQFTDGPPAGAVADLQRFELSPAGEAIAREMGFYPVLATWRGQNERLLARS